MLSCGYGPLVFFSGMCGGQHEGGHFRYTYAPMSKAGHVSYCLERTGEGVLFSGRYWKAEGATPRELVIETIAQDSVLEDLAALVAEADGAGGRNASLGRMAVSGKGQTRLELGAGLVKREDGWPIWKRSRQR